MAKITEDYVSFEIAKLLKEKGFDIPCNCYGSYNGVNLTYRFHITDKYTNWNKHTSKFIISCPTLQMTMKWLREEKGVAVVPIISSILDNERFLWDVEIVVAKTNETYHQGWIYESCERACESAIKYCLENLI